MVKKVIGPAGGKIEMKGDISSVTMEIPAGALAADTEITIRQVPTPPADKFMQEGMPVGNTFSFEPHGLKFSKVVEIIFTYRDQNLPKGANEGGVLVYVDGPDGLFRGEGGAVCDPLEEPGPHCIDTESYAQDIDVDKNLVTVFINKLSRRLPYYAGIISGSNGGANAAK